MGFLRYFVIPSAIGIAFASIAGLLEVPFGPAATSGAIAIFAAVVTLVSLDSANNMLQEVNSSIADALDQVGPSSFGLGFVSLLLGVVNGFLTYVFTWWSAPSMREGIGRLVLTELPSFTAFVGTLAFYPALRIRFSAAKLVRLLNREGRGPQSTAASTGAHGGAYPERRITASDMDATTLPPIYVPQGASAIDVTAAFLSHIEAAIRHASAPPKLRPVRIWSPKLKTVLASSAPGNPMQSDFYTLGLEGNGTYASVLGGIKLSVTPSIITSTIEAKELMSLNKNAFVWFLNGFFPDPSQAKKAMERKEDMGCLSFVGTWGVFGGVGYGLSFVIGPVGAIVAAVLALAGILMLAGSVRNSKMKQVEELEQLVVLALGQAYQSFDVGLAVSKTRSQQRATQTQTSQSSASTQTKARVEVKPTPNQNQVGYAVDEEGREMID